jgi:hypothetical protein
LVNEQVLLLKVAWGGKTLGVDFRPPSSGGSVGPYYTGMVIKVREALKNLKALLPSSALCSGFLWQNRVCPRQTMKQQSHCDPMACLASRVFTLLSLTPFMACGVIGVVAEFMVRCNIDQLKVLTHLLSYRSLLSWCDIGIGTTAGGD